MQVNQPRSLVHYLILALVLSAIFLAIMYVSGNKLTDELKSEATITRTGPVMRSHSPDGYDQRFRQLEQWLGQTQDAYEARFAQLEQRLARAPSNDGGNTPASTKPYEAKLRQLELWLGQTQDAYEARFDQLEQRLVQATAPHNARLAKIEQQLEQVTDPQVERFRNIEDRLAQTTSRLDRLSVSLAALTDDTKTVVAANKALRIAPPAALQEQVHERSIPPATPRPRLDSPTVAAAETAAAPATPLFSASNSPDQGKWAINLASYVSRKTASRKMASFQKQGVATEMVTAQVRGRTIYRVRIAGFDTLQAARAMAPIVERQLGLKETWIMANQASRTSRPRRP